MLRACTKLETLHLTSCTGPFSDALTEGLVAARAHAWFRDLRIVGSAAWMTESGVMRLLGRSASHAVHISRPVPSLTGSKVCSCRALESRNCQSVPHWVSVFADRAVILVGSRSTPNQKTCATECSSCPCPSSQPPLTVVRCRSHGMLRTLQLVGMPAVGTAFATNLAAHHSDRCGSKKP